MRQRRRFAVFCLVTAAWSLPQAGAQLRSDLIEATRDEKAEPETPSKAERGFEWAQGSLPYRLNVLVIAQFRAFANDLYTQREGERVFPLLGLGSSLGAWLRALAATRVIHNAGPLSLMTTGEFCS